MARSRTRKLMGATAQAAAEGAAERTRKARDRLTRPYTCNCGWHGRTYRAMNAHHLARHGNYWGGKAGKAMGRKVGKVQDAARRHARGWREAHGHIDRLGRPTPHGRGRPELRGTVSRKQLQRADRYEGAHKRAGNRERKAEDLETRGKHGRAARLRDKAARDRATAGMTRRERRAHSRQPADAQDGGHNMIPRSHPAHVSRAPQQPAGKTRAAPGSARPAPARSNGTRPAPSRTPPAGRLAPAPNGTRTAPARAGRTRTP
jgi:hypothetical protein